MVTIRSGISPGVRVQEIDLSDYVNNQVSTAVMLIGNSELGPAFKINIVPTERIFVETYGTPTDNTAKTFFAASGYYARGGNLLFTRVVDRPTARVSAIGYDIQTDKLGELPNVLNLDPELYNNDLDDYQEANVDGKTILEQSDIEEYYNTDHYGTQSFYTRHTFNRAFPRVKNAEYNVGDLVHDGWFHNTESGQIERFSDEEAPGTPSGSYPNGYVYQCIVGGLTSFSWNNADEKADKGVEADGVVDWDTTIDNTTIDGEVTWQRVAWSEETGIGGIRFKHGTTVEPIYYDPDDTDTFGYNVTINGESKSEDMVISAIGPGSAYNDFQVLLLGYEDAEKLKMYPFSLNIPRETVRSDSFVPEKYADWGTDAVPSIKRVLSKVTYKEMVDRFGFLSQLPEALPKSTTEFGLFLVSYDTISDSWSTSEYFRCSTDKNSFDENGNKLFVEDVINSRSNNIRVKFADVALNSEVTTSLPIPLAGGYAGELQNFDQVVDRNGLNVSMIGEMMIAADMYRESDIDVDVVIEGDKPLAAKLHLASLAEDLNGEAIAILDVPYEHSNINQIVQWTQGTLLLGGETGSYAALYHNRLKIYDKYTGIYRWVAPSGTIAGVYAQVDQNFFPWYAPAGSRRGTIDEVIDIKERFRLGERDALYANRVNPIAIIRNAITIYGQKTLLDRDSYRNRVNVRRLLGYLKRRCRRLAEQFVFEFNDEFTRNEVSSVFNDFLGWVQSNRGLIDFLVVCNETNNPPIVLDNNQMYIDIYVKPTPVAEFIYLRFFITRSGVNLQELATRVTP